MNVTPKQIRRTNRLLTAGTWFLIVGVVFYSLLTTTPFVAEHTAHGWQKSAPLLGLMVDVAFVMALQADSVLAQLGASGGRWPLLFRWFTGGASVFLNTWHAISAGDAVGVAVHLIAPALLLLVAEVGPVYRRRMAAALAAAEAPSGRPVVNTERDGVVSPVSPEVSPAPADRPTPAPELPQVTTGGHAPVPGVSYVYSAPEITLAGTGYEPIAICGGGHLPVPAVPERERLSTEAARDAIVRAYRGGLSVRDAARRATRGASQVQRVYAELKAQEPIPGQTEIPVGAAA